MKALFTTLCLLLSTSCFSQLFITIEPMYFRPGLLYNHTFKSVGMYGKAWYGDLYKADYFANFYTQNIKVGVGVSYQFWNENQVLLGVNHNIYFDTHHPEVVSLNKVHKISLDIGVSTWVSDNIKILFITDPLNWESCVGIHFKIKRK